MDLGFAIFRLLNMAAFVVIEGVLGHDATLARNAAVLSTLVFAGAVAMRWFVEQS